MDTSRYTIAEITSIIGGTLLSGSETLQIQQLLTDSRKLLFPSTSLFFALNGPRRSGTSFISELYLKGVRAFVITDDVFQTAHFPDATFIATSDPLEGLQKLAAHHRKQFNIPVIGITGSNGKTIVKEWLFQLLQHDFKIVRSPKSYNSQIGVPLSVWEINAAHNLGIFEAGISLPREMEKLEKVIQPTVGVFTNLGDAHNGGFSNTEEKVHEKLKLFTNSEIIIYCRDYKSIDDALQQSTKHQKNQQTFSWSRRDEADLRIREITEYAGSTTVDFLHAETSFSINTSFTDEASIENLITCVAVLLVLKLDVAEIRRRVATLISVDMRLQLRQGINGCSIIDDSYSADLSSLQIALDFLQQQKQHQKRTVILSDILQSGKTDDQLYQELAELLSGKNVDRLIGVGPKISSRGQLFQNLPDTNFFSSSADLRANLPSLHFSDETILLKGARVFAFEEISKLLQQKTHETVLEIDLESMAHNLKQYQQLLRPGVKMMVMVKASGYGSGSFEIANLLQFHKVDYLAVAYADEGVELRKAGISLPIMVMNPEESTFEALTKYDLEPELFSFGILTSFANYLKRAALPHYPVHIKLDTGMHRLGFEEEEVGQLVKQLMAYPEIKIQSVFSHLAASEDPLEDEFTKQQAESFLKSCDKIKNATGYNFIRHIANSSGISKHSELQMDMVRLGIGLYGVDANPEMQPQLKNVSTLKTTIAQIKRVRKGETVGYGRKAKLEKDSVIATVRIGYADGYPRLLSNGNGSMIVAGKSAPIVGNVCMDMTMIDITDIEEVSEGDQVIVFGEALPIWQVAQWAKTISYEIMTGISQRVKRVYFE